MTFEEFKEACKKVKNKNVRFVKIERVKVCKHCGCVMPGGTECLTIDKQPHDRVWLCKDCVNLLIEIGNVRYKSFLAPFNDESGALAYMDYGIAELKRRCFGRESR